MTTTKKTVRDRIRHLNPCEDAAIWADNYTSDNKAWKECPCGDWLLWCIGKTIKSEPWSDERKPLIACALECALLVKHLWPVKQKTKIEAAVTVIQEWVIGKATTDQAKEARQQLRTAADAADAAADAADAADADAAADAADAAAYAADAAAAADAADAAAYAAAYAAYAAAAAAYAAAYADAARQQIRRRCADIVRRNHFPNPPTIRRKK